VILPSAQTTYDYYSYLNNMNIISTYTELLTTEDLLYEASNRLGFPVMKGQATASQVGETKFVVLTVKDTDPYKAAVIANGLVDILIDQNVKLQTVQYESAERNLQARVDQAEEQIAIIESQITSLSTEILQKQIENVQAQMTDVQSQINALKLDMADIDPLSQSEVDRARLANDQAKIDELSPILALYQEIYTQLVVLGRTPDTGAASSIDLDRLKTTLQLYQQIYISSISSLETLRLSKAQSTPTVMQVETATKPTTPISPKPLQSAMLAAAIGLFVTAGIAFLIEFLDDTLKTPDEIKDILDTPVIGFIGELKNNPKQNGDSLGIYVAKNPRSPVAEAFRSLRTNLEYSSVDKPARTILVTSSGELEGKSTIAANLAIVEAQSGKNVIIVDADMRRPKVHVLFNKSNRRGLSDVVTGKLRIDDVVKTYDQVENLSIITCGTIPPNPSELLGSERMSQTIKDLEERFDLVIFDTPPMIVSDAQILSSKVDGVIFVVIPGQTRAIAALRPMEELRRIGSSVMGVVANKIPKSRDYYYGGYNYYSPYGSHYSYHSESVIPSPENESDEQAGTPLVSIFKNKRSKE
jgi:capsular exopolysaccharide synthesis family protein